MKLPLVKGKPSYYPSVEKCPQCKKRKVFEPHSMAILEGGALLMDRKPQNSKHSDALFGFLDLNWHGAHDNGIGDDRDLFTVMNVVEDAVGGQFSLYFCSTACLRAFFNTLVDELEKRIQGDKKREERLEREEKIDGLPKSVKKELDEMVKRGELEVQPKSRRARSPRKQS